MKSWVHFNLSGSSRTSSQNWAMIFASDIHYLWRIWNQELFETYVPSDDQVFHRFWAVFHNQQSYDNRVAISLTSNTPSLRHISWFPLAEGWKKCN